MFIDIAVQVSCNHTIQFSQASKCEDCTEFEQRFSYLTPPPQLCMKMQIANVVMALPREVVGKALAPCQSPSWTDARGSAVGLGKWRVLPAMTPAL